MALFSFQPDLASVDTNIGGRSVETLYAGPQGSFAGLAQVNARLPQSLRGLGEVDLIVSIEGKRSNVLRIAVK